MKVIKTMLADIEGLDATLSGLINSILDQVFSASKGEALCMLGSILAADVWECPNTVKGDNNNSGSKIPSTGDTTLSAIALMGILFAAGATILLLKKKKMATT